MCNCVTQFVKIFFKSEFDFLNYFYCVFILFIFSLIDKEFQMIRVGACQMHCI